MSSSHLKWDVSINPLCAHEQAAIEFKPKRAMAINQALNFLMRIEDPRRDTDVAPLEDDGPRTLSGYYRVRVNTARNPQGDIIVDHLNIRVIFRLLVTSPIGSDAHVYQLYPNDLVPPGGPNTRTIEIVAMDHRSTAYSPEIVSRVNNIGRYPRPPQNY